MPDGQDKGLAHRPYGSRPYGEDLVVWLYHRRLISRTYHH